MTNDSTKRQSTHLDLPDSGLGDDLRAFLGVVAPTRRAGGAIIDDRPPRTRNLRATFRATPNITSDSGFPGTSTFAPRRAYRRAAGAALPAAGIRPDPAPTFAPRSDDAQGRRAAVLEAGGSPAADRPAEPAAEGAAGRRLRGRPPKGVKKGAKGDLTSTSSDNAKRSLTQPLPVGARVSITDPEHPWNGHSGEIVSGPETYGLGWIGQRVKLDGNAGEAYVRPEQTGGKGAVPAVSDKSSPKYVPTESERQDARRLFREIGERFNENRKKSKTAAYAAYRHDLMANLDTLIMGGAIDLKEATTIITNLEQYTKETEAESTETPATILGRWLRMDASEIAELEKSGLTETGEESREEIDELDAATDPGDDGDSETVT
jgi:hypothetical protein